jgi:peroxiredoxin
MKAAVSLKTTMMALLLVAGAALAKDVSGPAPDFTLESRSGENIKLSELRGDVVMINFWASWCGPCRKEMPLLDDLQVQYKDYGFTLLGVNVDEDRDAALKLLEHVPVDFTILFDPESRISELYNVDAMPSTFLVDRDGKLRYLHRGYKPGYEDAYEKQVKELVLE